MLLLLIRHAQAGERDPEQWPDDTQRPLTDRGRRTQRRASRALGRLGVTPEVVLTSPWVRAAETAQILASALRLPVEPTPCEPLAAAPDLERLQEHVGTREPDSVVALVGHSPWMEELASLLLTGDPDAVETDFPKSGVMAIEAERVSPGGGTLQFFLRPRQLRRMRK